MRRCPSIESQDLRCGDERTWVRWHAPDTLNDSARMNGNQEHLDRLGGYRVLRRIATGGTSDVLLAKAEGPLGFERQVVLKLLLSQYRDDEQFARMFAREAAAYARLSHPSIVRLFDFFSQNEQLVMVLEFVDGLPLNRLRASLKDVGKKLTDMSALYIADRIFDALACAHGYVDETGAKSPVIHRDVNPSNVLIGWNSEVKLADFGIARVTGVRSDTQAGLIKGTFGYMAPEQVKGGEIGPHTDVYAAGVLLWEMLAHRKAIQRGALPEIEILRAMAEPQIVSLDVLRPDLDRRLREAVHLALEPDAAKRKITAEEVCRMLRDISSPGAGRAELHELLKVARERDKNKKKLQAAPRESEPDVSASGRNIPTLPPADAPKKGIELVPALLRPGTPPPFVPQPAKPQDDADATNENLSIDDLFDGLALPDEAPSALASAVEASPTTVPDDRTGLAVDAILRGGPSSKPKEAPRPASKDKTQPLAKTASIDRPVTDSRATVAMGSPIAAPKTSDSQKPSRPAPPLPPGAPGSLASTVVSPGAPAVPTIPVAPTGTAPRGGPTPILASSPALPPGAGKIPPAAGVPAEERSRQATTFDDPTVSRPSGGGAIVPLASATTTLMMGESERPAALDRTLVLESSPPREAASTAPPPATLTPLPPSVPPFPATPGTAMPRQPASGPPMASPIGNPAYTLAFPPPTVQPPPSKSWPIGRVVLLVFVALLSAAGGVAYVKRAPLLAALGWGPAPSASVVPSSEPTLPLAWGTQPTTDASGLLVDASLVPLPATTGSSSDPKPLDASVTTLTPDAGHDAGPKDAGRPVEKPDAAKPASGLVAHGNTTILSTANASPNHRIFFDGRVVGETPAAVEVPCGTHSVQLGSAGTSRSIDLPCGQDLTIGDR